MSKTIRRERFSTPITHRYMNLIVSQVKSGMRVSDLATKIGVSPNYLTRIMYGYSKPPAKVRERLSAVLGRSESWLFRRDGYKKKQNSPSPDQQGMRRASPSQQHTQNERSNPMNGGTALGITALKLPDVRLASSAAIDFNAENVTIKH